MDGEFSGATTPGGIFSLIRDGHARSRADLSRLTGMAPSTITLRVEALIRAGFLTESGDGESRGGRRPRGLSIADNDRVVAGIDLGVGFVTIGVYDLAGEPLTALRTELDFQHSPREVLAEAHRHLTTALAGLEHPRTLIGIGLAVPGPVSFPEGRLTSPSRMPGWNAVAPAEVLGAMAAVPVLTENDANAMAWGEFVTTGRTRDDLILLKAGPSIGMGIVAGGRLHRGARGMAGDVSHTTVTDAPQVLCSCGRFGCLDVVAGGSAIVTALRGTGMEVGGVDDLAELAGDGHSLATRLLRESGLRTGAVLSSLVSFFNPHRLVLAGPVADAEAFVAAVRSSVYGMCLPFSTAGLELSENTSLDLGARGAALLMLDRLFDARTVDAQMGDFIRSSKPNR